MVTGARSAAPKQDDESEAAFLVRSRRHSDAEYGRFRLRFTRPIQCVARDARRRPMRSRRRRVCVRATGASRDGPSSDDPPRSSQPPRLARRRAKP